MLDARALRPHYGRFLGSGRVLLTGHSHQAWPDVAREGVLRAFDDAALHADDKWGAAFEAADAVRSAVAMQVHRDARDVALDLNTHALATRFLSALPLASKRHVVTTAGEFHTLHRQLRRLAEEGVRVTFVAPQPVATLAERLAVEVGPDTAAVLCSSVLFETSSRVPRLDALATRCRAKDVALLVDAYHQFGVVPFDDDLGDAAFVLGGGYKYAQWGEGVCFLAVPRGCALRPVLTGWFADFAHLAESRTDAPVLYGDGGAARFAGATYDPTSHYRARAVVDFFASQGMDVATLRATSLRQTARLFDALDAAGLDAVTPRDPAGRGGFVAVRVRDASRAVEALRERGIVVDARGNLVRLGPAPYTLDDELDAGVAALAAVCASCDGAAP